MKADSATMFKVFQNGGDIHYILPHFQREYAWERGEWNMLLEDAFAIYEEIGESPESGQSAVTIEHFLGSLVVVEAGTVSGPLPAFTLVDGQQRLITLSLLLCALRRVVLDTNLTLAKRIQKLLVNADETGDVFYKLLPTTKYGDRDAYKAILKGGEVAPCESRIPHAFTYLYQILKQRIESGGIQPERLYEVLTKSFQVVFINLNRDESPYKIFESLNAKGKPLTQADLVRNFIAMTLPASGQQEVYCDHWQPIELLLQEKRTVGKSGIGELTAFLRHYLATREGTLCNEKHVYARFRDRMKRDFNSSATFVQEIERLHRFATLYDRLLRPAHEPNPQIRAAIERLSVLDISTAYPFLLSVSNACRIGDVTQAEYAQALGVLENYLMRRFLAEEPTNYLNKMFPTLWSQLTISDFVPSLQAALVEKKYPTDAMIRRKMLTRSLYQERKTTQKQLVFLLEQINRHLYAGMGGYAILGEDATIEHILPQNPNAAWKSALGSQFGRMGDFVHTIGNLTLVTQGWNSSLSNTSFADKKVKLAAHALKLNSDYFSLDLSEWNESTIQTRSNVLIDHMLEIWPYMGDSEAPEPTPSESANFHPDVVSCVSNHLGVSLMPLSRRTYESSDHKTRIVCAVSKTHSRTNFSRYWYAFNNQEKPYLEDAEHGYVAVGCGSAQTILLISISTLLPLLENMSITQSGDRNYWHLVIFQQNGQFYIGQPGYEHRLNVTQHLLPQN
jgi:hypothetical protein